MTLKKLFLSVLFGTVCLSAGAQVGRWFGRGGHIRDFQSKVTKVVLPTENGMTDLLIRDAIEAEWFISPYEFCSMEDFERLKGDSTYYFLIRVNGRHSRENEPAMEFLSLLKGGAEAARGLDAMPEILSLPLQPIGDEQGRIFSFLPAYVKIIQAHVLKVIRENRNPFGGVSDYADGVDGHPGCTLLFGEDDLASPGDAGRLAEWFGGQARTATAAEVDGAMQRAAADTLVTLVLAPEINQRGSYCYKMVISADTCELLFFRKHRMTARNGAGFLTEDLKRLAVPYAL